MEANQSSPRSSIDKKPIEHVESASHDETILQKYALLKDKSDEELKSLNKTVLKKLDWRFLPCITAMLLMKYGMLGNLRINECLLILPQLFGSHQRIERSSRRDARGSGKHDRRPVVCRYLAVLRRIHHLPGSGQRYHCEGQASSATPALHAGMVCRYHLHGGHDHTVVFHAVPLPGWRDRGPLSAGGLPYDVLVVHKGGVSIEVRRGGRTIRVETSLTWAQDGHLACGQHHLQRHLRSAGGRDFDEYGQHCWPPLLAVVLFA